MKATTYAAESEVELNHWWFVGRRELFSRLIRKLGLPSDSEMLDVGTSTGTNLRMLREMGFDRVSGVDVSTEAIRYCEEKGLGRVTQGTIYDLPFEDGSFDLVLVTDVIEHLDDDLQGLHEVERVLRPGGLALITVPAFRSLWGPQDIVAEHRRRYRMSDLINRVRQAEFQVRNAFYFNYLLFFPIFVARKLLLLFRVPVRSESDLNTGLINWVFKKIFLLDIWSAPLLRPPFGVSALVLAEKSESLPSSDQRTG